MSKSKMTGSALAAVVLAVFSVQALANDTPVVKRPQLADGAIKRPLLADVPPVIKRPLWA